MATVVTLDEFFAGFEESRPLFDALAVAIRQLDGVEMRVTSSQVAWRHRVAFAWAWIPDRHLHGHHAPLVASIALPEANDSPRFKEVVRVSAHRFMHHIEVFSADQFDEEFLGWLEEAWGFAG